MIKVTDENFEDMGEEEGVKICDNSFPIQAIQRVNGGKHAIGTCGKGIIIVDIDLDNYKGINVITSYFKG